MIAVGASPASVEVLRGGGRWTRDTAFAPGGKKMFVSVGSHPNVNHADTHKERDERGDNLVPDYIAHLEEGGFQTTHRSK